jgi:predicted transcriptional regulator
MTYAAEVSRQSVKSERSLELQAMQWRDEAEAQVIQGGPVMNSRRSKFDIMAAILRHDGATKSEIKNAANLSHVQLQHYLSLLMEGDFIVRSPGANGLGPYRVTSKGCELLERIEAFLEMIPPPEP